MLTRVVLEEMGFKVEKPVVLCCDNNSAVLTYASEVPEWRSATLATKAHATRSQVTNGEIRVEHVPSDENNADIHTKALPRDAHYRHTAWLGLYDASESKRGSAAVN